MRGLCECGCGQQTSPCDRNEPARGYVKGEPMRFLSGHNRRRGVEDYLVEEETGCWVWQRSTSRGYGYVTRGGRCVPAHRWYYEHLVGPIPEGLELDHLCRNPPCVNPDHLEPVTHAENMRRGIVPARARERHIEIERLWNQGLPRNEIADRLGYSRNGIKVAISTMRRNGYDLPYRYAMRDGKRVAQWVQAAA